MRPLSRVSPDDMLAAQLQLVPPFRALMRTQEQHLFLQEPVVYPVLDIGIGDGHFAAVVFPEGLTAGVDITYPIVAEGKGHAHYDGVAVADGTRLPYGDCTFRTVVSNCVIEHIPDAERLAREVGRVLEPGGRFVFSVINHNFTGFLPTVAGLRRVGLSGFAGRYGAWWNRRAVHFHFDDVATWRARLGRYGLEIDRHTYYMSRRAMRVFEIMHYYAVPSLAWHRVTGRWSLRPERVRSSLIYRWLRPYAAEPEPAAGACSFYVAHKIMR